ncbi:MAG: hypothetical protein ACRBN8_11425 [Nannocystales bacterium]
MMNASELLGSGRVLAMAAVATMTVACPLPDADVGEVDTPSGDADSAQPETGNGGGPSSDAESGVEPGTGEPGGASTSTTGGGGTEPGDPGDEPDETSGGTGTTAETGEQGSTGGTSGSSVCCVDGLSWRWVVGLTPTFATHSLTECDTFTFTHDDNTNDAVPPAVCTNPVSCEGGVGEVTLADVYEHLMSPGMQQVLAAGTALYGTNLLPNDGASKRITYGEVVMTLGLGECPGGKSPLCIPVPPALAELDVMLEALAADQPALTDCGG